MKYTIILNEVAKLLQEAKHRYNSIRKEDIDYSDIPGMTDVDWSLIRDEGRRVEPTVSMRLNPAVIQYVTHQDPKGYTDRMAAVLAACVKAQTTKPE